MLREYALLADGLRGGLIGPHGDIGWLCVPGWDSEAVFADLLGGRGLYTVTPVDRRFVWGGFYQHQTLIWTSRWVTTSGIIQCQEALAFPGEPHRVVLLRRVEALDGDAAVGITLDPRAGFGRRPLREARRANGVWSARSGGLWLRWSGAARAQAGPDGALHQILRLPQGGTHDLVLEICDHNLGRYPPVNPEETWEATRRAWCTPDPLPDGCLAHRDALHALAVLRGMTVPGGGMVAGATTSLPERAEAGRDYDYRYAWIRDQCFAGQAAAAAGADDILDASVGFVTARLLVDGPGLAPAYTADGGRPVPAQRLLDFLPGYPGGPVCTGNGVRSQFQLDIFGEALLLLAAAAQRDRLDTDAAAAMRVAAGAIADRWRQPDAGIWELEPRQWTHSKLTCVAGLRAAARVAPQPDVCSWHELADTILTHTAERATHPTGRWQRAEGDPRLDAALLLPAIRGALPADDPRTSATLAAVQSDLQRDEYVYRFRPDQRPLGEAEGAFLLCGLAAAVATHQAGDPVTAARWFERNRAACGPAGLYSEEYDVQQRQLRGNLPQAFVHALLLEAAVRLGTPAGNAGAIGQAGRAG